jgi:biopolymer transport protein ExbD
MAAAASTTRAQSHQAVTGAERWEQGRSESTASGMVVVEVVADGTLTVNEQIVSLEDLPAAVSAVVTKPKDEVRIMVRAYRGVSYTTVMEIANRLQDAGFFKIALVTEEIVE